MKYRKIVEGIFLERPNRFVAKVVIGGEETTCHVKNTGRCKELLLPNVKIFLEDHIDNMRSRKYRYSLIGVNKGERLINMDSQSPNKVIIEALTTGRLKLKTMPNLKTIKGEKNFGNSRFDIFVEDKDGKEGFVEVKGVTLENNGIAMFPDAPTERGVKHILELIKAKETGYEAYIIFLIQMNNIKKFIPNMKTHPEFGRILFAAKEKGVQLIAIDSTVTKNGIVAGERVPIDLSNASGKSSMDEGVFS